jgi:predicted amino acid-binding ACT domain protein
MPHPIKALKAAYAAVIQTLSALTVAIRDLKLTVQENTITTTALLETTQRLESAATATQTATAYLANAERHRREQSGQRVEL